MSKAPWNIPLPLDGTGRPTPALHPNSATIMARVNGWTGAYPLRADQADKVNDPVAGSDFNHPVFFAKASDPTYLVAAGTTGGFFESGGPHSMKIPANARPARGGDGHMCVIQPDGVTEWDLWDVTTDAGSTTRLVTMPAAGATIYARGAGKSRLDGTGLNTGNGDATAAKFGLLAGMLRGEEMNVQDINHALWFTIKGHNNSFAYPALASGGSGGFEHANAPPMGARFYLDYSTAEIEALSVPRYRKTILHALREYGAIAGDAGGSPIDLMPLSGTTYTALGVQDPFRVYLSSQGVSGQVDWRTGVDWSKMKVVSEAVSLQPSSSPWPSGWPAKPTLPTTTSGGSTFQKGVSNKEYIGLTNLDVSTSDYDNTSLIANNLVFRNCSFSYLGVTDPSTNIWLINCTIGLGGISTAFNIHNKAGLGLTPKPSNIVLVGCTIKDSVRPQGREDIHIEGCHATNFSVLWFSNCYFTNNSLYNLSIQNWEATSTRYCLLEDSVLDPCHQGFDVDHDQHAVAIWDNPQLGSPRDCMIRNNIVKVHDIYIDPIARSQNCVALNNRNQNGVLLPNQP